MPSPADRPLRLVVHVGPHKTGTTYLQTNFSLRAAALRAEGWLCPAIGERIAAGLGKRTPVGWRIFRKRFRV